MSARATPPDAAQTMLTVGRGLQVLRAFRSERAPLTNTELVRRTGLPKATVSRLTGTLVQLGFLRHRDGCRGFELAAGAMGMGHAFIESSQFLAAVHPCLQDFADRAGTSATLAVADGLDMMYVAYRASHQVATLRLGVGTVLPMGMSAIGRAYLWGLPELERRSLLSRLKTQAGEQGGALEAAIATSFGELDSGGVCCVWGGYLRNTFGLALPVRLGRQRVLLGMSCGKAIMRPDLAAERRRLAPMLRRAASDLEGALADFEGQP